MNNGFATPIIQGYSGWASEILHQLIDGKHPIIHRVSTIQGGAGFLPSTV
jgi:hypothetical protein